MDWEKEKAELKEIFQRYTKDDPQHDPRQMGYYTVDEYVESKIGISVYKLYEFAKELDDEYHKKNDEYHKNNDKK